MISVFFVFSLPFNQSGYAFLLFFVGIISIVNGVSLFFDERKINKFLASTLLINGGAMLIFDSLHMIGYKQFNDLKVANLVVQFFIGFLSIFFVWGHHYDRKKNIQERERKKPFNGNKF